MVVLTLLAEKRNHGYELEGLIEQRGMREWTEIGFSSIYYLLQKLASEGLVAMVPQPSGRGPARKVYSLTTAGRQVWQVASLAALATPTRSWSAFQLALSALPMLPIEESRRALAYYRASQTARLTRMEDRRRAQYPLPQHVEALFDHSRSLLVAELGWLDGYLKTFERKDDHGKD